MQKAAEDSFNTVQISLSVNLYTGYYGCDGDSCLNIVQWRGEAHNGHLRGTVLLQQVPLSSCLWLAIVG